MLSSGTFVYVVGHQVLEVKEAAHVYECDLSVMPSML